MTDKKQWEKQYDAEEVIDCPYCGADRPEHHCGNCYADINKETCWSLEGFCSEKCRKYIKEDLPKMARQKEELGIKCKCSEPTCAKCLSINCQERPKAFKPNFRF
ncbi:hypothetical protein HYW73_00975 [Candidatus Nomurabacteria bacterium]|nr:hypothetical protein [Candidatus Nomurabacteria bacterium]